MSPQDFSDTSDLQSLGDASAFWDTAISELLAQLQTLNVHQANIESATLSVDLPLRYRSGQPLYIQDFEYSGSHMQAWKAGTGADCERVTDHALVKGASWQLRAGSDGGRAATLDITQGMYEKAKLSFEWAMTWSMDIDYLRFLVYFIDGSNYYYVELYIDVTADEIQIYDDTPGYESIRSPIGLYADPDTWHFFKVTVDFSTGDYVQAFINEETIDLSDYTMYYGAAAAGDPLNLEWKLHGDAGKNPTIYLDSIAMVLED